MHIFTIRQEPEFADDRTPSRRIAELDGLRGLLAFAIVIFHLYPQELFWLWSCVDGFFVLSGFVITRLLLFNSATRKTLFNFYAQRVLRIWPVYFLTMAIALSLHGAYALKNGMPLASIEGIPQSLFFMQFADFYWRPYSDYFTYNYIRWFGHSWSLAVEEQFYWLWPVVLFLARNRLDFIAGACALLLMVGLWTRSSGHLVFLFAARADGLALGSLLAAFALHVGNRQLVLPKLRPLLIASFCFTACTCAAILLNIYIVPNYKAPIVLSLHYYDSTWLVFLFATLFATIIASLWLFQGSPFLRPMRTGFLLWLGGRSYAIYMFHPPIQAVMERVAEYRHWPHYVGALLTIVFTLLFAHLSFISIESWCSALRHRFLLAQPPMR